jgi:hypothetical protein
MGQERTSSKNGLVNMTINIVKVERIEATRVHEFDGQSLA